MLGGGKLGMFLDKILAFTLDDFLKRVLEFWKLLRKNLIACFSRARGGGSGRGPTESAGVLSLTEGRPLIAKPVTVVVASL